MIKREDLNEIINLNKKIHAEVSKLVRQDLKKLYEELNTKFFDGKL